MNRKLTREEAIRLHREMWTDMLAELGDDPSFLERIDFKEKWVEEHFPNEHVNSNCFLCEYAQSVVEDSFTRCRACPIAWNSYLTPNCKPSWCFDPAKVDYRYSPISVILALPSAEPKKGKWIRDGHHIRCDQCGMHMCDTDREGDRIPTEFCPNCGADMRGEQDE